MYKTFRLPDLTGQYIYIYIGYGLQDETDFGGLFVLMGMRSGLFLTPNEGQATKW